jgi:hypothetical protein
MEYWPQQFGDSAESKLQLELRVLHFFFLGAEKAHGARIKLENKIEPSIINTTKTNNELKISQVVWNQVSD